MSLAANQRIEFFYNEAFNVAIAEMERLAIATLNQNKKLNGFCNGMGVWSFYDKAGFSTHLDDLGSGESVKDLIALYRTWDEYLKITGHPLKIERVDGKLCIETDW